MPVLYYPYCIGKVAMNELFMLLLGGDFNY